MLAMRSALIAGAPGPDRTRRRSSTRRGSGIASIQSRSTPERRARAKASAAPEAPGDQRDGLGELWHAEQVGRYSQDRQRDGDRRADADQLDHETVAGNAGRQGTRRPPPPPRPSAPPPPQSAARAPAMAPPSMPPSRRRSITSSSAAFNSAAIDVPSASPRYPIACTSATLRPALTSTATKLTATGAGSGLARRTQARRCGPPSSRAGRCA